MATFKDLDLCDYFGPTESLRAVGWLDGTTEHPRGPVDAEFFESLIALLREPWSPFAYAGRARCPLCVFSGGPTLLRYRDTEVSLGSNNLFVPGDGAVYVAPSMVAHYIDAHQYQPPEVFRRAVIACPEMRSMAYLKAVRKYGIHNLQGNDSV